MKAYAIKHPKGKIYPWHISFFANETKQNFCRNFTGKTWKEYFKLGYRCVPVEITEIKSKK